MIGTRCATLGCDFVVKPGQRYCLACQIDRDEPEPPPTRKGRPPGSLTRPDGLSRYCARTYEHKRCSWCVCTCHQRGPRAA